MKDCIIKDYIVVKVEDGEIVNQFDTSEESIEFAKSFNEIVEVQAYDEVTETYNIIFIGGNK